MAVEMSWTVLLTAIVDEGGVTKIELIEGLIKKPLQPFPIMQRRMVTASRNRRWFAIPRTLSADASFD